jgi:hypothetical protein
MSEPLEFDPFAIFLETDGDRLQEDVVAVQTRKTELEVRHDKHPHRGKRAAKIGVAGAKWGGKHSKGQRGDHHSFRNTKSPPCGDRESSHSIHANSARGGRKLSSMGTPGLERGWAIG